VKIAVVEPVGRGGLIQYAFQLCREMRKGGAEVTLITDRHYELDGLDHDFELMKSLRLWDPKPAEDRRDSVLRRARRSFRGAIWYREWFRLLILLRRLRPDVVQFGDIRFASDLLPLAIARRLAPVMADVCHNVEPFSGGGRFAGRFGASSVERALYRRIYDRFDAIFVHYETSVESFSRLFPGSAAKVTEIVHGNEEIFREMASPAITPGDLRERLDLSPEARVVLFFGTLSHYKGIDRLLEAFESVARIVDDAFLVIAGHPTPEFDLEACRAESDRRGYASRLRIVANYLPVEEIAAWMELAALVVFPYRAIYQSGAVHLAQTFARPIVATRVGAMSSVIRDGESGLLVEPDDRAQLAAAIVRILSSSSFAESLGEAAAADAAVRFSWEGVAKTILDRYDDLLRSRGRR
jgi:glycosyltransferase involved in cell wall biosynthesis